MKTISILALFFAGCASTPALTPDQRAKRLVEQSVEAMGGLERFRAFKDVEYTYIYRDPEGKEDVSLERYVFDQERSWAQYSKREKYAFPSLKGRLVQGYDGKKAWLLLSGKRMDDPKMVKMTHFVRKTNYYWFAMMFKLLDPGIRFALEGTQQQDGVNYARVRVRFEPGVGDVQDEYLLYINPKTHLVDQFLFTIMDFGMKDPFLMRVAYDDVAGVKLPARRSYTASNWNGDVLKPEWTHEIMQNIRFDSGVPVALFESP